MPMPPTWAASASLQVVLVVVVLEEEEEEGVLPCGKFWKYFRRFSETFRISQKNA